MSGQQAAQHPDRDFEQLDLGIDVEVEIGKDPIQALLERVVEAHQPQGVQRLDDREAHGVAGKEELFIPAGHWLDLIVAPGPGFIPLPGKGHFRLHIRGQRTPVVPVHGFGVRRGKEAGRGRRPEDGAAGRGG